MTQSTALILRPDNMPGIRVLECDGPERIVKTHRWPGYYSCGVLSFEDWQALPDYVRNPRPEVSNYAQAMRINRLIRHAQATGEISARQLEEIRRRLETIHGPLEP